MAEHALMNDSKVFYETTGSGKDTIVLVHGWTCDHSFWRMQTPELGKHGRVIAIDLPGHGQSDKPEVKYTPKLFADAIHAVMTHAKVDRAVLAGHSMGAIVLRQYLTDHPKNVVALVLVDGAMWPPGGTDTRKQRMAGFFEQLRSPQYQEIAGKFITGMFSERTPEPVRQDIKSKMLATPQRVAVSAMESMMESDAWDKGPSDVPALVIAKPRPGLDELVKTHFPKVEYQPWDGYGHFMQMEDPAKFNAAVIEFWKKVRQ